MSSDEIITNSFSWFGLLLLIHLEIFFKTLNSQFPAPIFGNASFRNFSYDFSI